MNSIVIFTGILLLTPASLALKCFDCANPQGECSQGSCEQQWCTLQLVQNKREGRVSIRKGCASANSLGTRDDCNKVSADGTDSINCFCQSTDFCNTNDFLRKFPAMADAITGGQQPPAFGAGQPQTFGQPDHGAQGSFPFGGQSAFATQTGPQAAQPPFGQPNQPNQVQFGQFGGQQNTILQSQQLQAATCYQCANPTGDCQTSRCQGVWCTVQIVRNEQTAQFGVTKECMNTHPAGTNQNDCQVISNVGGTMQMRCSCHGELCNGDTQSMIQRFAQTSSVQGGGQQGSQWQQPNNWQPQQGQGWHSRTQQGGQGWQANQGWHQNQGGFPPQSQQNQWQEHHGMSYQPSNGWQSQQNGQILTGQSGFQQQQFGAQQSTFRPRVVQQGGNSLNAASPAFGGRSCLALLTTFLLALLLQL